MVCPVGWRERRSSVFLVRYSRIGFENSGRQRQVLPYLDMDSGQILAKGIRAVPIPFSKAATRFVVSEDGTHPSMSQSGDLGEKGH